MSAPRDWDAATYDRVSNPQAQWAEAVIDRLALRGDETVLDAGCGSGRVTRMLLDRLPRGRVIGVDASPSMVEVAAAAIGDRGRAFVSDLVDLELEEQVDAVFSNAVFHWIDDHDALFGALFAALRPGGRLVAQCGGEGNIDAFRILADRVAQEQPFAVHLADRDGPWNYQGAPASAERLQRAGFDDVDTWLTPQPVDLDDPYAFLYAVCLGPYLDELPEALREPYARAVTERAAGPGGGVRLDYVRLNIDAHRPGDGRSARIGR